MPITSFEMSEIATLTMYKESYDFMMSHPIVKQFKKENKKLKKEVANLKAMLAITQENMRLMMECKNTKKSNKQPRPLYTTQPTTTDDAVEVIDITFDTIATEQPNIKYEIIAPFLHQLCDMCSRAAQDNSDSYLR